MQSAALPRHRPLAELTAGLAHIGAAPRATGVIQLIARRPRAGERDVLGVAELDPLRGLLGDRWADADTPMRANQLTIMSARVMALLAPEQRFWPLAGDQLFADFDLSAENVPPGTRLAVGTAVVEASPEPHTGCKKFRARYGLDALRFIGAPQRKHLQLRGINALIVAAGAVRVGDPIRKL
jgi:hypothetical protein